ncbi:MAG: flagellar export protein FliJ [Sporomusaceae bacterium]|nr:flagellar export protein FliJ [Sporomusaceae bacterium]
MKPFRFRLEKLLEFRKTHKEQSQIAFLQATRQLRIEKDLSAELECNLSGNIALLHTQQQQSLSVEILKSFRYYIDKISDDINKQNLLVIRAEEHRHECLCILAEAEKNHKVVEKYRERKLQQYQDDTMKEEQKLLDEIGLQIYIRDK